MYNLPRQHVGWPNVGPTSVLSSRLCDVGPTLVQFTLLSDWIGCEEGYPYRRCTQPSDRKSTFVIFYCCGAVAGCCWQPMNWRCHCQGHILIISDNWISLVFRVRISSDLPSFWRTGDSWPIALQNMWTLITFLCQFYYIAITDIKFCGDMGP